MKTIVMLLLGFLVALFISGCGQKQIECVKPKAPVVAEANITQCTDPNILEKAKCSLSNFIEMKKERDSLRIIINNMMD